MCEALIFENGAHVGKVEVDERGIDDEVGYAADTLFEDLVGDAQRFHHRGVLGNDAGDLVVRDDDERIYIFFQVFQPLRRIVHALFAFKGKRLRDDGDGEDLQIACDLGDDRGRTRTGTAAHARGDKEKVGIPHRFGEGLFVLFRGGPADFGFRTRSEAFGKRGADLDLCLRFREEQDLLVGIDGDVTRALDPRLDHAVDCIVPRAAYADDLDPGNAGQIVHAVKHLILPSDSVKKFVEKTFFALVEKRHM